MPPAIRNRWAALRAKVARDEERQARVETNLSRVSDSDVQAAQRPQRPQTVEPEPRVRYVARDSEVARAESDYWQAVDAAARASSLPEPTGSHPVVCEKHDYRPAPRLRGGPQPPPSACPSCIAERQERERRPRELIVYLGPDGAPEKPLSPKAYEVAQERDELLDKEAIADAAANPNSFAGKVWRGHVGRRARAGQASFRGLVEEAALERIEDLRDEENARLADTPAKRRARHQRYWSRHYSGGGRARRATLV